MIPLSHELPFDFVANDPYLENPVSVNENEKMPKNRGKGDSRLSSHAAPDENAACSFSSWSQKLCMFALPVVEVRETSERYSVGFVGRCRAPALTCILPIPAELASAPAQFLVPCAFATTPPQGCHSLIYLFLCPHLMLWGSSVEASLELGI
jgi:hypothetical protein